MPLIVLIRHISVRRVDFRFNCILQLLWWQGCELLWALLIILVADSLQFWWLQHALIGKFLYTPDETVQVYANIIIYLLAVMYIK